MRDENAIVVGLMMRMQGFFRLWLIVIRSSFKRGPSVVVEWKCRADDTTLAIGAVASRSRRFPAG